MSKMVLQNVFLHMISYELEFILCLYFKMHAKSGRAIFENKKAKKHRF